MFIRNAWYVAAWDRDRDTKPVAATILGARVVLYRQANGAAAALEDACVHRKLPLSMGRVTGNDIECGYHVITAVFVPAGTPAEDALRHGAAFVMDSYNFLTPIDAGHTRYFWLQMHNAPEGGSAATSALESGVKTAFEEIAWSSARYSVAWMTPSPRRSISRAAARRCAALQTAHSAPDRP